jgi:integrase/recombinase XerD
VFTAQLREIFNKYCTKRDGDNFVFPFFQEGMSAEKTHTVVQDFIKRINRGAKQIGKDLELVKKITPYVMRHTYATRSIKKGVNPMLVSKNLAHQDFKTTQNYIGGFNDQELQEAPSVL